MEPTQSPEQAGAAGQMIRIDGETFDPSGLGPEGQALLERLRFVQARLAELNNTQALLTKARNAYIADLKMEMVQGRIGVDLSSLLGGDDF